ncbi:Opacity protein and related surface antigens [Legionella busanensis]|uniref:Opacity protein and related surface antigens n=1 Tax=Legionella busanensis TaxID=190655 RepID=A0A378JS56_9GAMM|nr:outer membrane beta-barrel protein [Legionella busanensis]STX50992.1 Opacity protein and related surface antigens [Legionella busanensis]
MNKGFCVGLLFSSLSSLWAGSMGPVLPETQWSGFYVGGNLGGMWLSSKWIYKNINPYDASGPSGPIIATTNRFDMSNVSGGAQGGFNYQLNQWVMGAELAYVWTDLSKTQSNVAQAFSARGSQQIVNTNIKGFFLATGRLGALINPDWLLYAKGGYARATIKTSGRTLPALPPLNLNWNTSKDHNGWVAGGGIEYQFMKNITLGVEYNYIGLSNKLHTGPVSGGQLIGPNNQVVHQVNANTQNVMGRLNILFG